MGNGDSGAAYDPGGAPERCDADEKAGLGCGCTAGELGAPHAVHDEGCGCGLGEGE
jgi:hypothetical protein